MTKKRGWEKRFAQNINDEMKQIRKNPWEQKNAKIARISALKDAVYLLGIAINKKEYEFAPGFDRFCKDLGVNFDKIRSKLRKPKEG